MRTKDIIIKTREYLDYIEEHVDNVHKAWVQLSEKCKDMHFVSDDYVYYTIAYEIEKHDMSKLSEFEFVQYRKSFYKLDNEEEYDMSEAWEHHKKNNPHHWDNWNSDSINTPYELEVNCVHMIVDWMAMGYKFGDTAQEYYENNKDKIDLPDCVVEFIYVIFERLKNNKE